MPIEAITCTDAERDKNIEEILRSYKETGKIGNTAPRDTAHAQEIASAIAYDAQKQCRLKRSKPKTPSPKALPPQNDMGEEMTPQDNVSGEMMNPNPPNNKMMRK